MLSTGLFWNMKREQYTFFEAEPKHMSLCGINTETGGRIGKMMILTSKGSRLKQMLILTSKFCTHLDRVNSDPQQKCLLRDWVQIAPLA
mmetsp:Transcript_42584/g.86101  ORF Transcript_42584/g.86101 Transcript_42584/m.86101 type:complete len:89 (-) Transcript_42584:478-744(-)